MGDFSRRRISLRLKLSSGKELAFRVHVLESVRNGKRYVGLTSKDVEVRLRQHNSGSNQWTRQNGPFRLVYWEEFSARADASKRERFLKSGAGRKIRDSLIVGD